MTAEIVILNKLAVALAADSAVTIASGSREEKIFDSADKLFELSRVTPIGIMIYNTMDFAEIPLQTLIHKFRSENSSFSSVESAATQFLHYLNSTGVGAPKRVHDNQLEQIVIPLLSRISERRSGLINNFIQNLPADFTPDQIQAGFTQIMSSLLDAFTHTISAVPDAHFVGDGHLVFEDEVNSKIYSLVGRILDLKDANQLEKAVELVKIYINKAMLSDSLTGIVIAGFGSGEIFPTLISFEIDGMVCGRLKYIRTNSIDIDREGKRASVVPFAQKEMVERFLYGLDESIQTDISEFCEKAVTAISQSMLHQLVIEDPAQSASLQAEAAEAERAFVTNLSEKAFRGIRLQSQTAIEDMVEFMPKPELAKMAEALVNLTSIKRRVSRGFETVGGPIDVAVISQSEGFIWVKRKHYFEADLNVRYLNRANTSDRRPQE